MQYLSTVADWFVMEGGEVVYDFNADDDDAGFDDDDCERPGWAAPVIHEVRFGELQVFVGESMESFTIDAVVDVGVLLRTGIPLPESVVEESLGELRAAAPDFVEVEVHDDGPGVSVWLAVPLSRDSVEGGGFVEEMQKLLQFADSAEAREVRFG